MSYKCYTAILEMSYRNGNTPLESPMFVGGGVLGEPACTPPVCLSYFMLWFIELTFTLHNWHELELVGVGHVHACICKESPHPMRLRVGALWPTLLGKFLVTVQSPSCLIVDPINQ